MLSKLTLKTERLAELTTDDLVRVNGAAQDQRTLLNLCPSVITACGPSWEACTTAMSCGCQPTWNCA